MTSASDGLPVRFVERLRRLLPAEALGPALASFAAPRVVALRVNTLRARPQAVWNELAALGLPPVPVPWAPEAAVLPPGSLRALQASAPHGRGELYVQGLSSQTAALVLAPRPGERVLDLCAAPGSKTSQIACRMQGRGELVANDKSRQRLYRLAAVLAAQGIEGVAVTCRRGESFAASHAGRFDRVLVDAPCSAEGRFRSDDPRSFRGWHPARLERLARQQERLLAAAAAAVRPGGEVLYATCTLAPEENEAVVARVLASSAGALELLPIELPVPGRSPGLTAWGSLDFGPTLARTVRLLPDGAIEAFFLARLLRRQ